MSEDERTKAANDEDTDVEAHRNTAAGTDEGGDKESDDDFEAHRNTAAHPKKV